MNWCDFIISTPDVLNGKARIIRTRIPVSLILGYLADGMTHKEILSEYNDLREYHIYACLDYAREISETGTIL
jgi:uncharacterized protein (DUF433 family)